jgi:predicted transcriptional regulator
MVPLFAGMLERDRKRWGLRVCRAAWLLGVSVREYRLLEAGDGDVTSDVWDRMVEVFGWPRASSR